MKSINFDESDDSKDYQRKDKDADYDDADYDKECAHLISILNLAQKVKRTLKQITPEDNTEDNTRG